jgi:hypothetical protein
MMISTRMLLARTFFQNFDGGACSAASLSAPTRFSEWSGSTAFVTFETTTRCLP